MQKSGETQSGRQAPGDDRVSLGVFLGNFNHAQYLPGALNALLAQEVRPSSITVVDDGSSDDSLKILSDYAAREPTIRVQRNEANKGYITNATEWLANCTHDYVYFAASDDMTLPSLFRTSLAQLRQNPRAGFCTSLCYILDEGDTACKLAPSPLARTTPGFVSPTDAAKVLHRYGTWMWGTATIYRRESLLRAGGFDPSLYGYNDTYTSILIALREGSCYIPEPQAIWRRFMRTSMSAMTLLNVERSAQILSRTLERLKADLDQQLLPGYRQRFVRRWLFDVLERQSANSARIDDGALGPFLNRYAPDVELLLPMLARLPLALRRSVLALVLRPQDIMPAISRRQGMAARTIPVPQSA
ncbi:MAG: glycosyltransferase family 2 protein [Hyphomicrobiales bacterium]|nr:MAG: glycosyltransferase family 2 protein [Hyphomicrobiales bacterium]